jgi:hypothetical protein
MCSKAARSSSTVRTIITTGSTTRRSSIDEDCILVIRGAGPLGWPGSAEVVNMQPPDHLLRRGINNLPTLGDGRQSGTSDSPSILNASPESAAGGGLAWLQTGDTIRIDLNAGTCDALVDDDEIARRRQERRRRCPRAPRPGKKSIARRPASSPTARCSTWRSNIGASRRRRRGTITETMRLLLALVCACCSRPALWPRPIPTGCRRTSIPTAPPTAWR